MSTPKESANVEWNSLVRPILAASYDSSNKDDLIDFIKSILISEKHIVSHSAEDDTFCSSFVLLAADYICQNLDRVPGHQMSAVCTVGRILGEHILRTIQASIISSTSQTVPAAPAGPTAPPLARVSRFQLLAALRTVCGCFSGSDDAELALARTDRVTLLATLKTAKLPSHISTGGSSTTVGSEVLSLSSVETSSSTRARQHGSSLIMDFLATPVFPPDANIAADSARSDTLKSNHQQSSTKNFVKRVYFERNSLALQRLGAGDTLLDLCQSLSHLNRYLVRYRTEYRTTGTVPLPTSFSDAMLVRSSLQSLSSDLLLVCRALSLPLLEPVDSPGRQMALEQLCGACILAAFTVATVCVDDYHCSTSPSSGSSAAAVGFSSASPCASPHGGCSLDPHAVDIVSRAVEVCSTVIHVLSGSSVTPAVDWRRVQTDICRLMFRGLLSFMHAVTLLADKQQQMTLSPLKSPQSQTPSTAASTPVLPRISLIKVQHAMNPLIVSLGCYALFSLSSALNDSGSPALSEYFSRESAVSGADQLTLLADDANMTLTQLLITIATVAYRRAVTVHRGSTIDSQPNQHQSELQRQQQHQQQAETSEETADADDSLLGHLFSSTLSSADDSSAECTAPVKSVQSVEALTGRHTGEPRDQQQQQQTAAANSQHVSTTSSSYPSSLMRLACQTLDVYNDMLVCSQHETVRQYVADSIDSDQLLLLSAIVHDVQSGGVLCDVDQDTSSAGSSMCCHYSALGVSVGRLVHNLLAEKLLTPTLTTLLLHLLTSAGRSEPTDGLASGGGVGVVGVWPLQLAPRCLQIVAQLLLLLPSSGSERSLESQWEELVLARVVLVWRRVLTTLVTAIKNNDPDNSEDLNVEHAQLLLFLFHNLQLMQKKSVLHHCVNAIVEVAGCVGTSSCSEQLLLLSRLLLLFYYIVSHLYETPADLVDQVSTNLFSSVSAADESASTARCICQTGARVVLYHGCTELEQCLRDHDLADQLVSVHGSPVYYTLAHHKPPANSTAITGGVAGSGGVGDIVKIDGLACSFLLGSPGLFSYDALYSAIVSLMRVGDITQPSDLVSREQCVEFMVRVRYCFTNVWRLCASLPPSVSGFWSYVLADDVNRVLLDQCADQQHQQQQIMLRMVWLPRLAHKSYKNTIRDWLQRQSVSQADCDSLMKLDSNVLEDDQFQLKLLSQLADRLHSLTREEPPLNLPSFSFLLALHSHLTFVQYRTECVLKHLEETPASLSAASSASDSDSRCQQLVQLVVQLMVDVSHYLRWSMLLCSPATDGCTTGKHRYYHTLLSITSRPATAHLSLSTQCVASLPAAVRNQLANNSANCPQDSSPIAATGKQECESLESVVSGHLSCLTESSGNGDAARLQATLKRFLSTLVRLAVTLHSECSSSGQLLLDHLQLLYLDASCQPCLENSSSCLSLLVLPSDGQHEQFKLVSCRPLAKCAAALVQLFRQNVEVPVTAVVHCVVYLHDLLATPEGRSALAASDCDLAISGSPSAASESLLVSVLMTTGLPSATRELVISVLKFFARLFQTVDKTEDVNFRALCSSINSVSALPTASVQEWLRQLVENLCSSGEADEAASPTTTTTGWTADSDADQLYDLLQQITSYLVREESCIDRQLPSILLDVAMTLGSQLFVVERLCATHPPLFVSMSQLSAVAPVEQRLKLFTASCQWLQQCKAFLCEADMLTQISSADTPADGQLLHVLRFTHALLVHISELTTALKLLGSHWKLSHTGDSAIGEAGELATDGDAEWAAEEASGADDDTECDDSDDESLNSKLCTFASSQRDYINQHWYHCHTCGMIDSIGACSVCVRVCHHGHDTSYAKYGSFFCDCGAREGGTGSATCMALQRRSAAQANVTGVTSSSATAGSLSLVAATTTTTTSATTAAAAAASFTAENLLQTLLRRRASAGSLVLPSSASIGTTTTAVTTLSAATVTTTATELTPTVLRSQAAGETQHYHHQQLARQLQPDVERWRQLVAECGLAELVAELVDGLVPTCQQLSAQHSAVGALHRAAAALARLHQEKVSVQASAESLLVQTGGCAESTVFDSVRLSFGGEQGQTIRQLLSAHLIRRTIAACLFGSLSARKQLLVVSHEKGKLSIIQLSALMKSTETPGSLLSSSSNSNNSSNHTSSPAVTSAPSIGSTSRRKVNVPRLTSASVPFTVLGVFANPCNDQILAVCGLKDCHVLTVNRSGSVTDHLALQPHLEAGNFIINAVWLTDSHVSLAIVTAAFVRVYRLSEDVISPSHYLLLPSGKIRDVCLVAAQEDGSDTLLIMSSTGVIYSVSINDSSSARNGPFYVTAIVEVDHPEIKWSGDHICGGGVSIYYSHALQILFFSFAQGKNFFAPFVNVGSSILNVQQLQVKNAVAGSVVKSFGQPLCRWSETLGHPGFITALTQTGNIPVVMFIQPLSLHVQDVRVLPTKSKVVDTLLMRAVTSAGDGAGGGGATASRTASLLVLCDDGSVRVYRASHQTTGFWLNLCQKPIRGAPHNQRLLHKRKPAAALSLRSGETQRSAAISSASSAAAPPNSTQFPQDFFESCLPLSDVEFGGNDVLQVYNVQQLRHRLNTTGLYIASTQVGGFTVEITNNDSAAMAICGVRVLMGTQDPQRAPSYIEIMGRRVMTRCTRSRWFDLPLSRDESLLADRQLSLVFGASTDVAHVTMVDSIKVYGKTKESFDWPDDLDDTTNSGGAGSASTANTLGGLSTDHTTALSLPELLLCRSLECLEGCLVGCETGGSAVRQTAVRLCGQMLKLDVALSASVVGHGQALAAALHSSMTAYLNYKDQCCIQCVWRILSRFQTVTCDNTQLLDPELFVQLVTRCRSLAVQRPASFVRHIVAEAGDVIADSAGETAAAGSSLQLFAQCLITMFKQLLRLSPAEAYTASVASAAAGLTNLEVCVHALCDILHVLMVWSSLGGAGVATGAPLSPGAIDALCWLLLSSNLAVSTAARQAIVRALRTRSRRRRCVLVTSSSGPARSGTAVASATTAPGSSSAAVAVTSSMAPAVSTLSTVFQLAVPPLPPSQPPPLPASLLASVSAPGDQEQLVPAEEVEEEEDDEDDGEDGEEVDLDMEELLSHAQALPLDLAPEGYDETMMDWAMALGLRGLLEDSIGTAETSHEPADGVVVEQPSLSAAGPLSDTSASAPGSDEDEEDEGSTAATDGSTLRTSPTGHAGSGGSESGASAVDSIGGAVESALSAHSSVFGDTTCHEGSVSGHAGGGVDSASGSVLQSTAVSTVMDDAVGGASITPSIGLSRQTLRVTLLHCLVSHLPRVVQTIADKQDPTSGVRAVPFFQVLLMLSSQLDAGCDSERVCLDSVISSLLQHVSLASVCSIAANTVAPSHGEPGVAACSDDVTGASALAVLVLRMLSVLMSRAKSSVNSATAATTTSAVPPSTAAVADEGFSVTATATATALSHARVANDCLTLLQAFANYWQKLNSDKDTPVVGGKLLKTKSPTTTLDMTPFFLREYVKRHGMTVFSTYPQLLTELALRIPYQIKKVLSSSSSSVPLVDTSLSLEVWQEILCEYMNWPSVTPFVRRQVRKLLLDLCDNKDEYRRIRDLHLLSKHLKAIKKMCGEEESAESGESVAPSGGRRSSPLYLDYDRLIEVVDLLKACHDVASTRTGNWHRFCCTDTTVLPFLLCTSYRLPVDTVSPIILQLLQLAAAPAENTTGSSPRRPDSEPPASTAQLIGQLLELQRCRPDVVAHFIRTFLLDSNSQSTRQLCHTLLRGIWSGCCETDRVTVVEILWKLWPLLPYYGCKSVQFADLLGFVSLKTQAADNMVCAHLERVVETLRYQNQVLAVHPRGQLYSVLSDLVKLDGYYLESEPCLVCNHSDVPVTQLKLTNAKVDSRYTTTTQLVRLPTMHTISRISLRIGDVKRARMVHCINVYYGNRAVSSVVELKNTPSIWHKAKSVSLSTGQTDVKLDFTLPIVACSLKFEYASFFENMQASSETLQCPRCSANVPAHPGVCSNCGENVYQCHKCRAINYDEKDPFLCNACGFCKYAKFEYSITSRVSPDAVAPIDCEEDRERAVAAINTQLQQADTIYHKLVVHKTELETLVCSVTNTAAEAVITGSSPAAAAATNSAVTPQPAVSAAQQSTAVGISALAAATNNAVAAAASSSSSSSSSHVNRDIQQLAHKYCVECRQSFDELSVVIQKVVSTRRQLLRYDAQQLSTSANSSPTAGDCDTAGSAAHFQDTTSYGRCFGCARAAAHCCVSLLRSLAVNASLRNSLCSYGLLPHLMQHNLLHATGQDLVDVCHLICLLTRDSVSATQQLNDLIVERLHWALSARQAATSTTLASAVRRQMAVLQMSALVNDSCWEHRIKCVVSVFVTANKVSGLYPFVMEAITLPCLRVIHQLMQPSSTNTTPETATASTDNTESSPPTAATADTVLVSAAGWLSGDSDHTYQAWKQRRSHLFTVLANRHNLASLTSEEVRHLYLSAKYLALWRKRSVRSSLTLSFTDAGWLRRVLFNTSSRQARQMAADITHTLASDPARRCKILDLLTSFLSDVVHAGEASAEYLALYQKCLADWKLYINSTVAVSTLGTLITQEIADLTHLEETSLSTDLSQGYSLDQMTQLLATLLQLPGVLERHKSQLLTTVLHGYLALHRLVIQRTKLIDSVEQHLLKLLDSTIAGNEEETSLFMKICVDSLSKYPLTEVRSPQFIFERLCSIIKPELNDQGPFLLYLEKDRQQEDFLQGRMAGNPYPSTDAGLGPLMRNVKNKICRDCELIALLEDDTGMELLVNGKIISLDLPVKEVYQKVWLPHAASDTDPMRVVYRMRGLLGDATEEFVETLETGGSSTGQDDEHTYRLASVLSECNGLQEMLRRMQHIDNLQRYQPLLSVLLHLMSLCIKTQRNRTALIQPRLCSVSIMLSLLNQLLTDHQPSASQLQLTHQLLTVLLTVLTEAADSLQQQQYAEFAASCGNVDQLRVLLDQLVALQSRSPALSLPAASSSGSAAATISSVSAVPAAGSTTTGCGGTGGGTGGSALFPLLTRLLPALVMFSEQDERVTLVVSVFDAVKELERLDTDPTPTLAAQLELMCCVVAGIHSDSVGGRRLKDRLISDGVLSASLSYLQRHASRLPPLAAPPAAGSDQRWTEFVQRPALQYVLRVLTGLANGHATAQLAIAETEQCVPIVHRLEQVSTAQHVGSLAENLLEALRTHSQVAATIESVRRATRQEKKRLAMAMRQHQLGALGMRANDKGQVLASASVWRNLARDTSGADTATSAGVSEHLASAHSADTTTPQRDPDHMDDNEDEEVEEEVGLTCVICREGYRCQPNKVLGVYTFSRRWPLNEPDCNTTGESGGGGGVVVSASQPLAVGYSTVSHFNLVHVDCHMAAVRLARSRDEWESAALQNANTRCNGLLPLWGPRVVESAFAHCLARHNAHLQEATGVGEVSVSTSVHDLCLLLLRLAYERSLSEHAGGGGRQSNLCLTPYLAHTALYSINSQRQANRLALAASQRLARSVGAEDWAPSGARHAEGPIYWCTVALLVCGPAAWNRQLRVSALRHLLVLAHIRYHNQQQQQGGAVAMTTTPLPFSVYRPFVVFLGLIDALFSVVFSGVTSDGVSSTDAGWSELLADYIRRHDRQLLDSCDQLLQHYQQQLLTATSLHQLLSAIGELNRCIGEGDEQSVATFLTDTLSSAQSN